MPSTRLHDAEVLVHAPAGRGFNRLVLKAPVAASTALPGQFLMLRVSDNLDPLLSRPFGISSVISKKNIEIFYRIVGRGTALLSRIEAGRSLAFLGPIGNGFPLPDGDATPVLIAGGSGFPPLHFLAQRLRSGSHVFIGSRNRGCLPPPGVVRSFREAAARVHIATEDGSMGVEGTTIDILNAFLSRMEKKHQIVLYACGPHAMLAAVSSVASQHAIPCFVSLEERMACGVGACMGCSTGLRAGGYKRICKEGPVFDSREISWEKQAALPVQQTGVSKQ